MEIMVLRDSKNQKRVDRKSSFDDTRIDYLNNIPQYDDLERLPVLVKSSLWPKGSLTEGSKKTREYRKALRASLRENQPILQNKGQVKRLWQIEPPSGKKESPKKMPWAQLPK